MQNPIINAKKEVKRLKKISYVKQVRYHVLWNMSTRSRNTQHASKRFTKVSFHSFPAM